MACTHTTIDEDQHLAMNTSFELTTAESFKNNHSYNESSKQRQQRRSFQDISIDLTDILNEIGNESSSSDVIGSMSLSIDSNCDISIGSMCVAIGIGISIGLNEQQQSSPSSLQNSANKISNYPTKVHTNDQQRTIQDITMDVDDILVEMEKNDGSRSSIADS